MTSEEIMTIVVVLLVIIAVGLYLIWWRTGADPALIKHDLKARGAKLRGLRILPVPEAHGIFGMNGRVYEVIVQEQDRTLMKLICSVSLRSGVSWKHPD